MVIKTLRKIFRRNKRDKIDIPLVPEYDNVSAQVLAIVDLLVEKDILTWEEFSHRRLRRISEFDQHVTYQDEKNDDI